MAVLLVLSGSVAGALVKSDRQQSRLYDKRAHNIDRLRHAFSILTSNNCSDVFSIGQTNRRQTIKDTY